MKQANQFLFWFIGLPMAAIIWVAMVGPKTGAATLLSAAFSLGIVLLIKNRKEN